MKVNGNRVVLRDLILFILMIILVLFFWRNSALLLILLLIESLAATIFYGRNDLVFFVLTGLFGVCLEVVGGLVGIWRYLYPNFITVPLWIFFCWGFTFLLLRNFFWRIDR